MASRRNRRRVPPPVEAAEGCDIVVEIIPGDPDFDLEAAKEEIRNMKQYWPNGTEGVDPLLLMSPFELYKNGYSMSAETPAPPKQRDGQRLLDFDADE